MISCLNSRLLLELGTISPQSASCEKLSVWRVTSDLFRFRSYEIKLVCHCQLGILLYISGAAFDENSERSWLSCAQMTNDASKKQKLKPNQIKANK